MKRARIPIDRALLDGNLLGAALGDPATWSPWFSILRAAFALVMSDEDRATFAQVSGGREPPTKRVDEFWVVAGRRSGKSRTAANIASFVGAIEQHRLSPGEVGYVLVLAASKAQASVVFEYIRGAIEASPILRQQIVAVRADEIELRGRIVIGTHSNSFRTVRGRTLVAAIFDEVAYWRDETSSTPDLEVYRAVLPALAASGGMLIGISSPYRRAGLLHEKHRDHFGQPSSDILVIQAPSLLLNGTLNATLVERARASDPDAARAEWDAEFRSDLSALLDDASIHAAINADRPPELPPRQGISYVAFIDASGAVRDRYSLCIGHLEGDRFVADVVRGRAPPFDPHEVTHEFVTLAKEYGVRTVVGDRYSGEWLAQAVRGAGAEYEVSGLPKSALYLEAVPAFSRGSVSIPNLLPLVRELRLLERRVHRSGKDSVDHPRNGSDDYANALVGAMWVSTTGTKGNYVGDLSWLYDEPAPLPVSATQRPSSLIRWGEFAYMSEGEKP